MTQGGKNEEEKPLPSQVRDLENGIFNMVITLCRHLEAQTDDNEKARNYVAHYLEKVAYGLRSLEADDLNTKEQSR